MKVQLDLNAELWALFRSKVINEQGKTLAEVVPGVIEPALRDYLEYFEPRQIDHSNETPIAELAKAIGENELLADGQLPIVDRVVPLRQAPEPTVVIRHCDLCEDPVERLFSLDGQRVCYACWKKAITAIPVPAPQTDTPPEAA